MDRERVIQVFFFGFLAVMAYELYVLLGPFFTPIAWAILLAFMAHPLLVELDRLMHRRSLSATIITAGVTLGVLLPALWLSGRLANEAQSLYTQLSSSVGSDSLSQARDWLMRSRIVASLDRRLDARGFHLEDQIPKLAAQGAQLTSEYLASHATAAARNVATAVIDFGIILLTFFYLLRDGEGYYEALVKLTPLHEDDKHAVFETLRSTLASVMRGLMLTALIQGVTIGAGMLVFGVPYWAFLGILSAAAGLLPFGGTALVWVPAAIYLYFASGVGAAIGLIIWSIVAITIIDNFVKPSLMKHGTGLPTLALFFGIAGGLEAYGPVGIFLGPAVLSVFAALLRVYRKTYGDSRREAA
jgi:predicted PurR-regulated permease PerM